LSMSNFIFRVCHAVINPQNKKATLNVAFSVMKSKIRLDK
jgi:hypothetical protein